MKHQDYVEFEIQGFVPPYDKLRWRTKKGFTSCGTARLGMSVDVFCYGHWAGGVIDHKELREIRDAINAHLEHIDSLSDEERHKALNPFRWDEMSPTVEQTATKGQTKTEPVGEK